MFKIGDTIVYSDGKIYYILEEIEKDFGLGLSKYFVLKQHESYVDEKNTTLYISIDKVNQKSRFLTTKEEADKIIKELPNMDTTWIKDCKQRKIAFSEATSNRDLRELFRIIKTLHYKSIELEEKNKSLTITDKRLMDKLKYDSFIELSIALGIDVKEVEDYIEDLLNK